MTADSTFFHRLSRAGLLLLAVLLGFVLLRAVGSVLLLLFAALLLGLLFEGLADALAKKTGMGHGWALAIVLILIALGLAGVGWLIGPQVAEQVRTTAEKAPEYVQTVETRIEELGVPSGALGRAGEQVMSLAQTLVGTVTGALVNTFILLFGGIFLAATPKPYFDGVVKLFPSRHHERVEQILRSTGHALRRWLIGRGISMLILGVFTGLGLMLFGVPLALTLAVLAALLSFIPYVGGFVWLVVGAGAALATGSTSDLYAVVGVYLAAQAIESNLLLPLVQRRTTDILPFVLIAAQLTLGTLAGGLGVLVAAPLAVATLVIVQMAFVQDTLGNPVHVLGATSRSEDHSDGPLPEEEPLETASRDD
jgi:predicted PurR-regulated permease PerM